MTKVIEKPLSEAKSKLSEIVKLVECDGVEVILMRYGKPCVRIVPFQTLENKAISGIMRDVLSYDEDANLDLDSMDVAWGEIEADGEKFK